MPEERRLKKTDTRLRPTNTPDNECLLDCERRAKTEVACDKGGLGNRGGRISFTFNCLVAFYIHVPVFKLHSHRPETVSITGTKMILFFCKGKAEKEISLLPRPASFAWRSIRKQSNGGRRGEQYSTLTTTSRIHSQPPTSTPIHSFAHSINQSIKQSII